VLLNEALSFSIHEHTLDKLARDAGAAAQNGVCGFSASTVEALRKQCGVEFVKDLCTVPTAALRLMHGVAEEEKSRLVRLQTHLVQKGESGEALSSRLPISKTFIHFKSVGSERHGCINPVLRETAPGQMESGEFRIKDASCQESQIEGVDLGTGTTSITGTQSLPSTLSLTQAVASPAESEMRNFISRNGLDNRTAARLLARPVAIQQAVMARGDLRGYDIRNPASAISGRIADAESSTAGGAIGAIGTASQALRRPDTRST
jgi:hypothetical protein